MNQNRKRTQQLREPRSHSGLLFLLEIGLVAVVITLMIVANNHF